MKVGVSPGPYRYYPKEIRYQKIKEDGFDCLDYAMSNTEIEPYTLDDDAFAAYLANDRQIIEDAGIFVHQVHGPWRWPPQDFTEEDRAERMEKMMRSIRGTAILGCQNWVIHPIMPYGTHDREEGDVEFQIQQTWELNVVFMRKLLECAKENNVIISIENMPMTRFSLGSVSDIMRLVREIDDDNFRVCLDTGHVNVFAGHSLYDAVMEIGDKLQTLHIHDNSGYGDEHKLPWLGTADWAGFGRALREIGFDGVFSYEANVPKGLPKELYPDVRRIMRQCADFILRG